MSDYQKVAYRRNGEKIKARVRQYREDNLEVCRQRCRDNYSRAPDPYIERARARETQLGFSGRVKRDIVLQRDLGVCGICGEAIMEDFHLDHILPLSRGGEHCYENVQLAHPFCNLSKNNREGGDAKGCTPRLSQDNLRVA